MNRNRLLLAALLLLPLAASLLAFNNQQIEEITIVGTVISHSNTKDKQKGVPDKWHIDLNDDLADDLVLETSEGDVPGSELVRAGVDIEAVIVLTNKKREIYELLAWIKIGKLD